MNSDYGPSVFDNIPSVPQEGWVNRPSSASHISEMQADIMARALSATEEPVATDEVGGAGPMKGA